MIFKTAFVNIEKVFGNSARDKNFTKTAGFKVFKEAAFSELLQEVHEPYNISSDINDYMFLVARALTANVPNENLDCFTEGELLSLKKDGSFTYETFRLDPLLEEHDDSDIPKIAGGFIVDAFYDDTNSCDKKVITLVALDLKKKSHHREAALAGKLKYSMGCCCGYTICSLCGNRANYESEYCFHIKAKYASGNRAAWENCYDVSYRELSIVADPADKTAVTAQTCSCNGNGEIVCK